MVRKLPNNSVNSSIPRNILDKREKTVGSRSIQRGKARQAVDGKDFRLADEIRYIQEKAPTTPYAWSPLAN
jgi:hypothetical protein